MVWYKNISSLWLYGKWFPIFGIVYLWKFTILLYSALPIDFPDGCLGWDKEEGRVHYFCYFPKKLTILILSLFFCFFFYRNFKKCGSTHSIIYSLILVSSSLEKLCSFTGSCKSIRSLWQSFSRSLSFQKYCQKASSLF